MFPSFTSLAQREEKRLELLEKAQRRVRQENAKRDMYAEASWGSDADKVINLSKSPVSQATQTDEQSLLDDFKKKPDISLANSEVAANNPIAASDIGVNTDSPSASDIGVNTVSPSVADIGVNTVSPPASDIGVNTVSPPASDIGVNTVSPPVADIGVNTVSKSTKDTEEQISAFKWIKALYASNPNWAALKINPVSRNTGEDNVRFYLGEKASRISVSRGTKSRSPKTAFDWVLTVEKIRDILYDGESNSIDESSAMRLEDPMYHAELLKKWLHSKRKAGNPQDIDSSERSRQRLEDSFAVDRSTDTKSEQTDSKLKLFWIINKNIEILESSGLKKRIAPILHGGVKSTTLGDDGYVWVDGNSIGVFGKDSNRFRPVITELVNWHSTLQSFKSMIRDEGIDLVPVGKNNDVELTPGEFMPGNGGARHGEMSGPDGDMNESLTNADNDAKKILHDYYSNLQTDDIKIAFRLSPMVKSKQLTKAHKSYYFSQPTAGKAFNIRNGLHKLVSGEALKTLNRNISWMDTFNRLMQSFEELDDFLHDKRSSRAQARRSATPSLLDKQSSGSENESGVSNYDQAKVNNLNSNLQALNKAIISNTKSAISSSRIKTDQVNIDFDEDPLKKLHDESEKAYQKYGEALKIHDTAKEAVNKYSSKASRSALSASESAVKATKTIYQSKLKLYLKANREQREISQNAPGKGLKGRGLRGAGVGRPKGSTGPTGPPYQTITRKGKVYNLNDIQGTGLASAYIYKQIGSKFIRIPDLNQNKLNIVYTSRKKVGPIREISKEFQSILKDLVYNQNISQAAYDELSIDDQKLFKEVLAATHIQHAFKDELPDPMSNLRMEYEKLKGELMLGNDNPSIIKQLKSITVDMYANRLIGDNEFKDIIVRLI